MNISWQMRVLNYPLFHWAACVCIAITIALPAHVRAAAVESLSNDVLIQEDKNVFWQATVKCENNTTSFQIRQEAQQTGWCSENTLLPCHLTKLEMANEVCLNIDVLAPSTPTASPPEPTPQQEVAPQPTPPASEQLSEQQAEQRRQEARRRQQKLEAEIRTDELALRAERRRLEAEKQAVAQADRELILEEQQLEAQLRELAN